MKVSEEGRGLLGFHSKGPVLEELALCKEWAFFQYYDFHRYLVFLWVFGCWVFSLFSLGTTALFMDNKYLLKN